MKSKLKAVAVACLLALQLFSSLVPSLTVGAEESGTAEDHVSFTQTTIFADLVDPNIYAEGKTAAEIKSGEQAAAATLLEKYPLDASRGTADASVITSTVEKTSSGYSAFFYVYIPGGTESVFKTTFTLKGGERTYFKDAELIGLTATLVKFRVDFSNSEYESFREGENYVLNVLLFEISHRDITSPSGVVKVVYTAQQSSVLGGTECAEVKLSFSSSGELIAWSQSDALHLDVHLSASRYSTARADHYDQINTAMFLVPTSYLDNWKRIDSIEYQYSLLEGVPMLVTECDREDLTSEGDFFSLWKNGKSDVFGAWYGDDSLTPIGKWAAHADAHESFLFMVDEIKKDAKGCPELTDQDVIDRYLKLKDSISPVAGGKTAILSDYLRASSYENLATHTILAEDFVSTDSYANNISAFEEWLIKCFGYKIEDDSINVSAIQIGSSSDFLSWKGGTLTDDDIKQKYALDDVGLNHFNYLMNLKASSHQSLTVVVFHYLTTDYFTRQVYSWREHDQALFFPDWVDFPEATYYCENAIIDDFKIITMNFGEEDNILSVPVVMESMTFIKAPESPGVVSPIVEDDDPWWKQLLEILKILLKIAGLTAAAIVIVFVVLMVIRFFDFVRKIFNRRGGGG